MSNVNFNQIDQFLNAIAEEQGYDRDSLSLTCKLIGEGPTVRPNDSRNKVEKEVEASPDATLPSAWYDSLGHRHLQFDVVLKQQSESGETVIPKRIFTFQHHTFPGCCRLSVQRWVKVHDSKKWSDSLRQASLTFRRQVAGAAGTKQLFISTGPSFNSDELIDEFTLAYDGGKNKVLCIDTLK